jgi:hypothetical protein
MIGYSPWSHCERICAATIILRHVMFLAARGWPCALRNQAELQDGFYCMCLKYSADKQTELTTILRMVGRAYHIVSVELLSHHIIITALLLIVIDYIVPNTFSLTAINCTKLFAKCLLDLDLHVSSLRKNLG